MEGLTEERRLALRERRRHEVTIRHRRRHFDVADAVTDMAARYGHATLLAGLAWGGDRDAEGDYYNRCASRRLKALYRIAEHIKS